MVRDCVDLAVASGLHSAAITTREAVVHGHARVARALQIAAAASSTPRLLIGRGT